MIGNVFKASLRVSFTDANDKTFTRSYDILNEAGQYGQSGGDNTADAAALRTFVEAWTPILDATIPLVEVVGIQQIQQNS